MKFWNRLTPQRTVIAGAILATLAYCQDLPYDFILDDVGLILMNPRLTDWHNWKTMFVSSVFPGSGGAIHYRPIYGLWLLLNHQLFGFMFPWWHLSSLLLHACITLLVFKLGVKVLREPWAAALGALLFAFHPIHAESVAYVAASTDLLVALFSILAILTYFEFRERQRGLWLAISIACGILAMFSKENAVILPWMILGSEWLLSSSKKEGRIGWGGFLWSLPYFVVVFGYLGIRTALFGANLGPGPGESRIRALLDAPLILLVYLKNLFWPVSLSFFYPIGWSSHWTIVKIVAFAVVTGIILVLMLKWRTRLELRLLLWWTAILFAVPLSGAATFLKEDWVHDRHMYLVSVPLCLLIAAVIVDRQISGRTKLAVSSIALSALLVQLVLQVPRFQSEDSIYSSALKVSPDSVLAHAFYASALWTHGNREQAFREFRRGVELTPESSAAHEAYALALEQDGRSTESLAEYEIALRLSPGISQSRAYLLYKVGSLELESGNATAGTEHLQEAVAIDPNSLNYHAELARAFKEIGRPIDAAEQARLEAAVRAHFLKQHSTRTE